MKKNTLAALILTTLAAGQLASLQAHAAGQLNVWEDIKKSAGIKTAVSDFEKQYNVKVNLQEMPYAQQLEKLRLDGPAGIGPDVLVIPNDQLGGAVVQDYSRRSASIRRNRMPLRQPPSMPSAWTTRCMGSRRRWKPWCLSTTRT